MLRKHVENIYKHQRLLNRRIIDGKQMQLLSLLHEDFKDEVCRRSVCMLQHQSL